MSVIRKKTEDIRCFILEAINAGNRNPTAQTAEAFNISRQSANRHIRELVASGILETKGAGKTKHYELVRETFFKIECAIDGNLDEDDIWQNSLKPKLRGLPDNVLDIWHYGVTEMINNVKEHSGGQTMTVWFMRDAVKTVVWIVDDGIGIFRKIQEALGLPDKRQSVLELAKGKLTTDPKNHSGEGVFFTSRAFDHFAIYSDDITFTHTFGMSEDWIMESEPLQGSTTITMEISNMSARNLVGVFDEFSPPDEHAFNKTVVPLRMATFGEDALISRSQAKRVMRNLEKFSVILLDFSEISLIGQGFADEIFRVYRNNHPDVDVIPIHANPNIEGMIARALATAELNKERV